MLKGAAKAFSAGVAVEDHLGDRAKPMLDTFHGVLRRLRALDCVFVSGNVSKKSLTLNLRHPDGRHTFLQLVEHADVVMENYRPGTLEKLGFGWDELRPLWCRTNGRASTRRGPDA